MKIYVILTRLASTAIRLTIFPTSAPAWGSSALAAFSLSAFFFALLLPDIDVNAVFSREIYKVTHASTPLSRLHSLPVRLSQLPISYPCRQFLKNPSASKPYHRWQPSTPNASSSLPGVQTTDVGHQLEPKSLIGLQPNRGGGEYVLCTWNMQMRETRKCTPSCDFPGWDFSDQSNPGSV